MRIVAGKYRRRLLLTNPGLTTRPVTDRAKVILFDLLQSQMQGARVADIFAGTGSMGLEALSRGALSCVFFENDRRGHELLEQNVQTLKAGGESVCWRTDVFRTSFRPQGCPEFLPYSLIFFDPPYRMTYDIKPGSLLYFALERLARDTISVPGCLLILRCDEHATFDFPPAWQLESQRKVNSMVFYFFRKQASAPEETATVTAAEEPVAVDETATPIPESAEPVAE